MKVLNNIILMIIMFHFNLNAQPDAASKQLINGVIVYQDIKDKQQFYYAPIGMKLMKNREGKPVFKFIQMRYTGTRTSGDQGEHHFKSLISFSVVQQSPSKVEREEIITLLKSKNYRVKSLQPIAISNLMASLVHAADSTVTDSTLNKISGGFFENSRHNLENTNWKERDFTLRLNNNDAQLFWESLHGSQPTISIDYAFYSKLAVAGTELSVAGNDAFKETMSSFSTVSDSTQQTVKETNINSGAFSIDIDTEKWPDLLQQIDINERIPPEYAALDVYCFDFNNGLRPDLYAKRIEIKAKSVGNSDVTFKNTFKYSEPEEYAKTIKFIYAVKLNEPYQFQITEIFHDGTYKKTELETKTSWHEILDITSKPQNH